jgi:uncharacterized spore protein YtfJ
MLPNVEIIAENIANQESANKLLERLVETARPEAVFGSPVTQGEYTVVTAAEVSIGMGFGFGGGGSVSPMGEGSESVPNYGTGGGGGGGAAARPVAAIEIGPQGVIVEPIIDVTKIVLAFFTALGAMAVMMVRMMQAGSRE